MNGYIMFPNGDCVHVSKLIGSIKPLSKSKIAKKKLKKTEKKVEVAV